jgi:hypothetical protein
MVHRILNDMYHDTPGGLEGNEDCGQMSAWYVLSALGFYPVTPGTTDYIIGTPLFDKTVINLENGKQFIIKADGPNSNAAKSSPLGGELERGFYIQSAKVNDKPHTKSYISYFDITNGGSLNFVMGANPSAFGRVDFPSTAITDNKIILNPVIDGGAISFKATKTITIGAAQKGVSYYYTTDGSAPTKTSEKYAAPFSINKSATIKAIAINATGETSFVTTAVYKKAPHNWTIKLNTQYEQQYDGNGPNGLIDDIRGEVDWRKGNWQGYQKTDMDVVIDLQKTTAISSVTIGLLQDTRAWIVLPKQIIIEVSVDGKQYTPVYSGENFLPIEDLNAQVKNVEATFTAVPAKYVRVKALQYGKLPAWHEGAGGDTHIFADEIGIK